jgi:NADH-quinone oxidoreductase subunit F
MKMEQVRATAEAHLSQSGDPSRIRIYVAASAADSDAGQIFKLFQKAIEQRQLKAVVFRTGSFGYYDLEPVVLVEIPGSDARLLAHATPNVIAAHLGDFSKSMGDIPSISELPLFNLQKRIALRNCGWIDPENINHYLLRGQGYTGLSRTLTISPPDLIRTSIPTALKGRRGQGCSTQEQWRLFAEAAETDKYLLCNAVDSDPKSLTSRLLLESDPHSVLEGMLISAYAAGASRCYLFVEEKANSVNRLRKALDQMKAYNLLGSNILNSRFHSEIEILEMPETVISGHRVELFRCIAENQVLPHILPAHPASGLFSEKSVLVVNPESMSNLSAVLGNGVDFSQGSKVVTLTGSIAHHRTLEVSHGTTIQNIIDSLGGGVSKGKTIKAVQLGGPSGAFFAPNALNHAIGCNAFDESFSSIGSGTIEVIDSHSSILNTTKDIMAYLQAQSCGKCVFCREGCLQMLTILEDISENKSRTRDLDLLVELGNEMQTSSLCDFGRTAPNAVLSGIELFRNDYEK